MCGITGIINFHKASPLGNELHQMTESIAQRGPDDEGYVLFDSTGYSTFHGDASRQKNLTHIKTSIQHNYNLGFGFRQLKIIDLTDNSHQPMTDESKNFWIVFNGEIYNYKEIRLELEHLGYKFYSASDTEVLLKSYIEWGENALQKLNGMFAFAIYNIAKNELFIARDRMGIKPLYYHQNNNVFIFGSSITSILKTSSYTKTIDFKGLWENFRFSIAQQPTTCFRGIAILQAGHYIKINLNSKEVLKKQYWEIPIGTQDHSMGLEKATNELEEALYKAVSYRTIADVNVGTFMSGGIDSTTISVFANKVNNQINALTLGYEGNEEYNEINEAKDTANLHKIPHIVKKINAESILKNIHQNTLSNEEPYHALSGNFNISKMASDNGLKVMLNGLGGDELFGGYDIYKKLKYWEKFKRFGAVSQWIPGINEKIKKGKQLLNYKSIEAFYNHYYTTFTDVELQQLFTSEIVDTSNTLEQKFKSKKLHFEDNFEALSFYNLKSYISNYQMPSTDKSMMNFSIEGRFPMLDHHFIETAFKIPSKFKIHQNQQKFILRKVAEKHIAKSCLNMQKKGLILPLEYWINHQLKEMVFDSIHSLKKRHIFSEREISKITNSKNPYKIWQLVSTEIWLQNFF